MKRENVVLLVTTGGEHIIGERLNIVNDNGEVTLEAPVSMVPDPNPQNRGRMLFMPYLQFTNLTRATFPDHDVRHVLTEVKEDLVNAYAQQFGDGIQVPKEKNIILG